MAIQSYRDLRVWQTAMELTLDVYRLSQSFPKDERFGLTSQVRRAATSVALNIAEGHGRSRRGEYLNHLSIARGSAIEVEVSLLLAEKLSYVAAAELEKPRERCDAICRMLTKLKRALSAEP